MNGWQKDEEAVYELRLSDAVTKAPIDPVMNTATITFTKPDASTVDVELAEAGGIWSGVVLFDQLGPWVPRLVVEGEYRVKRRLDTIHVGED
jgi:hypothetical protein